MSDDTGALTTSDRDIQVRLTVLRDLGLDSSGAELKAYHRRIAAIASRATEIEAALRAMLKGD